MEDGLRVEIEKLHKMLDAVHARVYEQGLIIEQQQQEINSLKAVYNDHEIKITHLQDSPPPTIPTTAVPLTPLSYKDVLKAGLPDLTSSIFNEQAERTRRSHNIVIKDKRSPTHSLIQPSTDPSTAVKAWLLSHGALPKDVDKALVRVLPIKADTTNEHVPGSRGRSIIVTLPTIENRYILISQIKKSIKSRAIATESHVYVDPDLTPSESQEQFKLRKERNEANASRSDEDKLKLYYTIRRGKVIKLSM
jgi:hypothetical protein